MSGGYSLGAQEDDYNGRDAVPECDIVQQQYPGQPPGE